MTLAWQVGTAHQICVMAAIHKGLHTLSWLSTLRLAPVLENVASSVHLMDRLLWMGKRDKKTRRGKVQSFKLIDSKHSWCALKSSHIGRRQPVGNLHGFVPHKLHWVRHG